MRKESSALKEENAKTCPTTRKLNGLMDAWKIANEDILLYVAVSFKFENFEKIRKKFVHLMCAPT